MKSRRPIRHILAVFLVAVALMAGAGALAQVNLSEDLGNLADRHFFVRVGVIRDASLVRVFPRGDFYLHDRHGRVLYTGSGDTALRFSCHEARPARKVYYVLLRTFEPNRGEEAERFVQAARNRLGVAVSLQEDPRQDRTPSPIDGSPPPPARLVATLGPYESYSTARAQKRRASGHYKVLLYDTLESEADGRIEVHDKDGRLLASATGYLGVRPKRRKTLLRAGVTLASTRDWWTERHWGRNRAYRGLIELWVNPRGRLSVVNRVFIEHYLYGVVPAEIGAGAPLEMRKAQAVISRSVAVAKIRRPRHSGWHFDLCDEQHCQVYKGALTEDDETNLAIDQTRGEVCVHGNQVINAVFSQCCGGITADNEDAWDGSPVPYLRSRIDAPGGSRRPDYSAYRKAERWVRERPDVFCNSDKEDFPAYARHTFRWSRTYSATTLARLLRQANYGLIDRVVDLKIVDRTDSGRIASVQIETNSRRPFRVRQDAPVRRALGNLPSSFFTLDREYNDKHELVSVTIKGAGRGHGVGLCQVGAIMMAHREHDYLSILKHYYRGVEVYRIYR